VQSEYSIFSREIEQDVLPICRDTGTSLVAYSPLGRGMLTGSFKRDSKISEADFRGSKQPRFSGDAYAANLALVDRILDLGKSLGVNAAEIALAWIMAKQDNVFPIAGTTKLTNLKTNLASMELTLSLDVITTLNALADQVVGTRYDEEGMAIINV
jgi:aryl-alcohol dehydrogenase-like predicted oxidoreductase